MAKDAFTKHQKLLTGNTNRNLKKRLIKTLVWSVLLYGSESWMLKKDDIKRLESCKMWIWRRMEKISCMEGACEKRGGAEGSWRRTKPESYHLEEKGKVDRPFDETEGRNAKNCD